jgi:hypothetical protein
MLRKSNSKKVKPVKKVNRKFFTKRFKVRKGKGKAAKLAGKGKVTAAPKKIKKMAQIDELDFEDDEE